MVPWLVVFQRGMQRFFRVLLKFQRGEFFWPHEISDPPKMLPKPAGKSQEGPEGRLTSNASRPGGPSWLFPAGSCVACTSRTGRVRLPMWNIKWEFWFSGLLPIFLPLWNTLWEVMKMCKNHLWTTFLGEILMFGSNFLDFLGFYFTPLPFGRLLGTAGAHISCKWQKTFRFWLKPGAKTFFPSDF